MNAMNSKPPKPGHLPAPTARGHGAVTKGAPAATLPPPRVAGTAKVRDWMDR